VDYPYWREGKRVSCQEWKPFFYGNIVIHLLPLVKGGWEGFKHLFYLHSHDGVATCEL
jgi:hypothetical protein